MNTFFWWKPYFPTFIISQRITEVICIMINEGKCSDFFYIFMMLAVQ